MAAFFWAALLGLLAALVWLASFRALTADDLYALGCPGNSGFYWHAEDESDSRDA
jgi:hypothetical protein